MLRSRLFWNLFAAYALLTLVTAGAFVAVLTGRQREMVRSHVRDRLHDAATVLRTQAAGAFDGTPPEGLQARLRQAGAETEMRLTLIAADGSVLADSATDPDGMDDHSRRPEILEARSAGVGVAERPSPTLRGARMMYVALPVGEAPSPAGFVRAAMDMATVNEQVAAVQRRILGTAAGFGGAALLLTYIIVGRITRPVGTLTRAAEAMAAGDLQQQVVLPRRDELGTLARAFNTMSAQITARVAELERKGRELEANNQRLTTVLGGMVEGVVAVDAAERILFVNGAARSLLDFVGANPVGRPLWETLRNSTIREVVRSALGGGDPETVELEIPRTQSVVAVIASRLPGEPCPGVVLVLHDVTELRRLENLRREFVSNVSHELKTPLTSIQAYTETLLNGAIDDAEHNRQFLHRIEEQAERLHALILDLLRLARIESGHAVFELTAVALDEVLPAGLEFHAAVAASRDITLTAERPETAVRVLADADGLRTIFDNLVDNAIKYTPARGHVTVRWRSDGTHAVVEVADSGVGIPRQHLSRIFERFYRADKARSRELGGTGLGLAIVKHLVQVFEGSVHVASQPGTGSTFTVRLPLAQQPGSNTIIPPLRRASDENLP